MTEIIETIDEIINDETERLWDELPIPDELINRETRQPPTANEWEQIKTRARMIINNRYASPEQMAWAMSICPTGIIVPFEKPKWMK